MWGLQVDIFGTRVDLLVFGTPLGNLGLAALESCPCGLGFGAGGRAFGGFAFGPPMLQDQGTVRRAAHGLYEGFQKLGGPFLAVLIIRALLFWGTY